MGPWTKSPVVVGAAAGECGMSLRRRGSSPGYLPVVLVVRLPAGRCLRSSCSSGLSVYLNYPSALIRQSGERRGRQAERERSRLELGACSQLAALGWRVPPAGHEEEEGGEGTPLLFGALHKSVCGSGFAKPGPRKVSSSGKAVGTGMGCHASGQRWQGTDAHPSRCTPPHPPLRTHLPSGMIPGPKLCQASFLRKASSENGASLAGNRDQCPDPIPEHPRLRRLSLRQHREVASRSAVSLLSPSPAREAAPDTGAAAAGSGVPGTAGSPPQTPGTCQSQGFESRWLSYFLPL